MADYGKIDVEIWADGKFRRLSPIPPCGQGLWVYLLAPRERTMIPGLIPAGEATIAESLRWPFEAARAAFAELAAQGMVEVDASGPLIWLPKAIKRNLPSNQNQVKGWGEAWRTIPECPLKHRAWLVLREAIGAKGESWAEAFRVSFPEPGAEPLPEPFRGTVTPNRSGKGQPKGHRSGRRNGQGNHEQEQDQKSFPPPAGARARDEGHDLDPEAEQRSSAARPETASGSEASPAAAGIESPGLEDAPAEYGAAQANAASEGGAPSPRPDVGEAPGAADRRDTASAGRGAPGVPPTGRLSPLPRRNELLDARFSLTADVIGRCAKAEPPWYLGHAGSDAQRVAVENAIAFAGPEVATSRLLAFVRAERAAGREPQPGIGWRLDEIQGAEGRTRRQVLVQDGDIRVGVAAPAPAEAFQGGERELR